MSRICPNNACEGYSYEDSDKCYSCGFSEGSTETRKEIGELLSIELEEMHRTMCIIKIKKLRDKLLQGEMPCTQ